MMESMISLLKQFQMGNVIITGITYKKALINDKLIPDGSDSYDNLVSGM